VKLETKLARVFSALADDEKRTESTASQVLAIVKDEHITTVEKFDEAVRAAYEANGWNAGPGRPVAESKADSVPSTVRTFVSWVRAAFHANLRITKFETFQELRKALGKTRDATGRGGIKIPDDVADIFRGVQLAEAKPNGGLFHDIALVYVKLDSDHRGLFEKQLNRLLSQYRPRAFPSAAVRAEKKAAIA
jgi:hypothetical protein